MLKLALRFELRALFRRRVGLAAVIAFLAVGALAILVGQRHMSRWHDAMVTAAQAQDDSRAEAKGFFERGEKGPANRPWVDLAQPSWQDRYAATRLMRKPGPLAGIAAGAVDPAPVAFQVSAAADPLAAGGYRIENPELDAGAVDLVFVLAVLAPLLIGVLGVEIGGRERQEGIDRLVILQAGESRRWLVARMVAVTVIGGSACATLCIAAGLVGGAGWVDIATLAAVAVAYTIAWSGLMLAVNAYAQSIRGAAFAFGMMWTLLCVLLPTFASEVSLNRVEADFAVGETLDARAARQAARNRDPSAALRELYALHPELQQLPAAKEDPLDPKVGRHALDLLMLGELAKRHHARRDQENRSQAVSERAAWFTPVVALTLGLERLAGVGPEAASGYRDYLMDAVEARAHWVVTKAWAKKPLTDTDFDALTKSAPPPFRPQRTGLVGPVVVVLLWGVAGWLVALVTLARRRRR